MKRIKYKNVGNETVRFTIATRAGFAPEVFEVAPGECCEVPAGYCKSDGARRSFIDRRGRGMLVPADTSCEVDCSKPCEEEKKEREEEPSIPVASKEEPKVEEPKAEEPKKKKTKKKAKKKVSEDKKEDQ